MPNNRFFAQLQRFRTAIFAAGLVLCALLVRKITFSFKKLIEDESSKDAFTPIDESPKPRRQAFNDIYKVGRQLGAGAFSIAYEAHLRSDPSRKFAVKITKRKNITADIEKTIRSEIDIMRSLDHPNIVKYVCHFEEEKYWFVVLELLHGGEVFDRIVKKLRYDEQVARDLVVIVLNAVKYIHDRNIVHRDLKLENLLLQSNKDDAAVKVADFGFAKSVDGADGHSLTTQCGSPLYVAPEIISKIAYGKPVDMWAIGVITFILLGGYPPFQDEGKQSILFNKIKAGKFEFEPEFWDHISAEAKDLIQGLLVVDCNKRLNVEAALSHPWITRSSADLAAVDLHVNLQKLKQFNARKRFRAAAKAVIAINKLSRSLNTPGRVGLETPVIQTNGGALLQPEFHRSYSAVGGVDVYFWNDDYESGIPSLASPPVGAFTGEQVDSRMPFSPVASPAVASRGMESIGSPSLANNEYSSPWWN